MKKIISYMFIIFLVISFSLSSSSAVTVNAEDNAALFSEALNSYYNQDYQKAVEGFENLLNAQDLNEEMLIDSHYYAAMSSVELYDTTSALEHLQALEEVGYQNGRLYWNLGQLYLNKDRQFDSADFDTALKYLNIASDLGINSLSFKRDLAYAYRETEQIDKAESIYNEILAENPTAEDYLNIARIKEEKGELNKAVEFYESALMKDAEVPSIYLNLAQLYYRLEYYNSAVEIYKQGIEFQANFTPYYVGLGESYLALNNLNEAEKYLKEAVELNPRLYYSYYLIAQIYVERGNDNQALNYYAEALKNNPDYVKAFLGEGKVHLENGDYYKAISRFSLAVEKNPEYAESHYYLGLAYYRSDMKEAAAAEFRKAVHIDNTYSEAREMLEQIEGQ